MGSALAGRQLGQHMRDMGMMTRGPAPMKQKDRSRFLSSLEEIVQAIKRQGDR